MERERGVSTALQAACTCRSLAVAPRHGWQSKTQLDKVWGEYELAKTAAAEHGKELAAHCKQIETVESTVSAIGAHCKW